jgi:hypothetical protein
MPESVEPCRARRGPKRRSNIAPPIDTQAFSSLILTKINLQFGRVLDVD